MAKQNNKSSFVFILVWIVLAFVCIQGYCLIQKGKEQPVSPKIADGKKPVQPPIKIVKPKPLPDEKGSGKLTIVIDDWGYNKTHCKNLQAIKAPLGVAILPELPYSLDVLRCSISAGKEPMLHLPLEPKTNRDKYPGGYIITTEMSQKEAKKIFLKMLGEFKGIVGVNNHMGSKATEDPLLMTTILSEVKRRGLFFVDSVTSEESVCGQVAAVLKMRIGRRDVFLDNRNERLAIEKQFALAARIAKKEGHALIIGHDRALTLQIIKEQTEKMSAQGFEFITVKDYIKTYDYSRN
jgi:uncharacterized protein